MMWNVEAKNTINGDIRTVAAGFLSEEEAQALASKKARMDAWLGLEEFYVVEIRTR